MSCIQTALHSIDVPIHASMVQRIRRRSTEPEMGVRLFLGARPCGGMAYALASKASTERYVGSNPTEGTKARVGRVSVIFRNKSLRYSTHLSVRWRLSCCVAVWRSTAGVVFSFLRSRISSDNRPKLQHSRWSLCGPPRTRGSRMFVGSVPEGSAPLLADVNC